MPRQVHDPEKSRRAALVYLQGGMTLREVAERFSIHERTIRAAIDRVKAERSAAPEDEVTC